MRLSTLTRFAAPLVLLLAAIPGPSAAFYVVSYDHLWGPSDSSVGSPTPFAGETNERIFANTLATDGDTLFIVYSLTSAGALTNVSRNLTVTFAGNTLFQCNAKTTCPGNKDSIAIRVTLMRTGDSTGTALVEYNDRQNGGSAGVSTNYTTLLTGLDWTINNNLALNGGSTGTSAAAGDLVFQFANFTQDAY